MTPDVMEFLRALHPEGFRTVRALLKPEKPESQTWSADNLELVAKFIEHSRDTRNLYVGVAERTKGGECSRLHALFCDQDFKDSSEAQARGLLQRFPLPPSAVVASGGGLQSYWLLAEPLSVDEKPRVKAILRALATALSGDLASAEPAHILRLPDTLNFKYTPPRPVVLESWHAERRYALDDILAVLPPLTDTPPEDTRAPVAHKLDVAQRGTLARRWLSQQPLAVEGQHGDAHTFQICAAVTRGFDLQDDAAFAALQEWNARCQPPWSERELREKARNGREYGEERIGGRLRGRRVALTYANQITPKSVHWVWQDRIPNGELTVVAGREGLGKSTLFYTLAAQITRGALPGMYAGEPREVIVATAEDSWEHTIVPRLLAANADLKRVARIDVKTVEDAELSLTLPTDIDALADTIIEHRVGLVGLDPVMSFLDRKLDSHKDADVRAALIPLANLARSANTAVVGLAHVNKGTSRDPLTAVMGSKAFVTVPRAVMFVVRDTEDEHIRLLGEPKNNTGRTDLPVLRFRIVSQVVARDEDRVIDAGRVEWDGESERSISDVLEEVARGPKAGGSRVDNVVTWLEEYVAKNGWAWRQDIVAEGEKQGYHPKLLGRARERLGLQVFNVGPRKQTVWCAAGVTLDVINQEIAGGTFSM